MEKETIKVKFLKHHYPRKKGEVAELKSKWANHYLSIGVAVKSCLKCEDNSCEECLSPIVIDNILPEDEGGVSTKKTTKKTTKK